MFDENIIRFACWLLYYQVPPKQLQVLRIYTPYRPLGLRIMVRDYYTLSPLWGLEYDDFDFPIPEIKDARNNEQRCHGINRLFKGANLGSNGLFSLSTLFSAEPYFRDVTDAMT